MDYINGKIINSNNKMSIKKPRASSSLGLQEYLTQSNTLTLLPKEESMVYKDHQTSKYSTISTSQGRQTINPLAKLNLKRKVVGACDLLKEQKDLEFYLHGGGSYQHSNATLSQTKSRNQKLPHSYSQDKGDYQDQSFQFIKGNHNQSVNKAISSYNLLQTSDTKSRGSLIDINSKNHGTQRESKLMVSKLHKLRFLLEENAIFKEESEAKIDEVIKGAMKKEELRESREYLKLKKIIEGLQMVGEQTKFELGFNLDLVFSHQEQSKQYEAGTQFYSHDNMVLVIDLLDNLQRDMLNNKFDTQSYEICKLLRIIMRQINNPVLNQLLQAIAIWMLMWVDQVIRYQQSRVNDIKMRTSQNHLQMKDQLETKWQNLEESVKAELYRKEVVIREWEAKYEKLRRDKEAVEDILRHRDSEISMLSRNPDYDCKQLLVRSVEFKGMISTLQDYLNECEEVTEQINPQIESIKFLASMFTNLEGKKKLEDAQKSQLQMKRLAAKKVKLQQQAKKEQEELLRIQRLKELEQKQEPEVQEQKVIIVSRKSQYPQLPLSNNLLDSSLNKSTIEETKKKSDNPLKRKDSILQPELASIKSKAKSVICQKCGEQQETGFASYSQKATKKQTVSPMQPSPLKAKSREQQCQTLLSLTQEPLASIANQLLTLDSTKRRNTIVNNVQLQLQSCQRKVMIMPKEMNESTAKQAYNKQMVARSLQFTSGTQVGNKLSDIAILKMMETAMEEMVRFEVNEQSPYAHQMHKVYEFKEYLMDHLLTQYGLRNIAGKNYDYILQRVYEYCERDYPYSKLMLNTLGQPFPITQKVWSINKQHVCIYSMILFQDAQNLSKSIRSDASPKRRVSRIDFGQISDAYNQGGLVNIFDLIELMIKNHADNSLVIKIIEDLKPGSYLEEDIQSIDSENQNEDIFFELAQMKLTSKLAKFGFDLKYFVETLDYKTKGRIKFGKLLKILKERFSLFLSPSDEEMLCRYFKSGAQNHDFQIQFKEGPRPFTGLLLSQVEFQNRIKGYMINKAKFAEYVIEQYDDYMNKLCKEITQQFINYDKLLQRGGINLQQFSTMTQKELRLMGNGFSSIAKSNEDIEKLFNDALEYLEENELLKQQSLLGLSALQEIIMERNLDSLPFYYYMKSKFNQGRRMTLSKQQIASISDVLQSPEHNHNTSGSPVRRNTLSLKKL